MHKHEYLSFTGQFCEVFSLLQDEPFLQKNW